MAPKSRKIPVSVRQEVLILHRAGNSNREIGNKVNLSFSTVRYIIERGTTENKQRTGRPRALNERERRKVVKDALRKPTHSAQKLAHDLASCSGKTVTPQTIRNVLHNKGIRGRRPLKKPYISEVNRKKHLEFAKEFVKKPVEFREKIIFF